MDSNVITRPEQHRNSSVELFRIVATFLVLIVHFYGWFIGGYPERLDKFDTYNICEVVIACGSCTCVNCFLIITGWYGLKFKWKHVWTIWSVVMWIYVSFYLATTFYYGGFSIMVLLDKFFVFGYESYFVQCYLMLLFLSPILNSFIEKFGRKILPYSLAFWGIEIIFDWIFGNICLSFGYGYRLTHFILMYILGQTAYLYREDISQHITTGRTIFIYLSGIILMTILYIFIPGRTVLAYSNPINIVMASALFLAFERKHYHNKVINWFSSSTFAVYIAHCTSPLKDLLRKLDLTILNDYSYGTYLALTSGIIVGVFIASVLYDKIRIIALRRPGKIVCDWISRKVRRFSLYN